MSAFPWPSVYLPFPLAGSGPLLLSPGRQLPNAYCRIPSHLPKCHLRPLRFPRFRLPICPPQLFPAPGPPAPSVAPHTSDRIFRRDPLASGATRALWEAVVFPTEHWVSLRNEVGIGYRHSVYAILSSNCVGVFSLARPRGAPPRRCTEEANR